MRKDMHKVVVERPRWNPGPGKLGRAANLPDELLPRYEGMRRPYKSRKAFTDLLGPLRRWLRSQVGRPWNDVYSEASEVIKPDSLVRLHIKTHLFDFVERHTFMHRGEVCALDRFSGHPRPVQSRRFGWQQFYVHPESGLLLAITPESRRELWRSRDLNKSATLKWLHDRSALKRINGIWFNCEFREIPVNMPFKAYDCVIARTVGRAELINQDGVFLHCVAKRQLSRRELRRHSLTNEVKMEGELPFQCVSRALKRELRLPSVFNGDHDVIAASRPVKAFVSVQIRLVTPLSKPVNIQH